tara:strand:+ start:4020 stop:4790 length:771 start_codon:yes stop_codon:yes gene_type:complete
MASSEEILSDPSIIQKSYTVRPIEVIQYPDKIKSPHKETLRNLDHGAKYSIGYLGSGVSMKGKDITLGTNYYLKAPGKCNSETSSEKCKGKDRYVYLRNIPTGTIPPFNLSFYGITGCNLTGLTEGRGLIPGLYEDVYDMNPVEITRAVIGSGNIGSDECKEMTLPVGYKIYDKKRRDDTWKLETRCTSGHHTMTETTDGNLNDLVRKQNLHIKKARIPGPLQFRENFSLTNDDNNNICVAAFVFIGIATIVFLRN